MDASREAALSQLPARREPAAIYALNVAGWLAMSLLASAALAWLAVVTQRVFAPFLLFPLLFGVAVGLTAVALSRLCQPMRRSAILAGTLLCVAAAFAGQYVVSYVQYRWAYEEKVRSDPRARLAHTLMPGAGPATFRGYMSAQVERGRGLFGWTARGGFAWLLWSVECLLAMAGGLLAAWHATYRSKSDLVAAQKAKPSAPESAFSSTAP